MNLVTIHDESELTSIVDEEELGQTQLTQWFVANQTSSLGHHLTYSAFPQKFTWDSCQKKWKFRKRGFKLGRVRYVHPTAGETFFLRMLLSVVRGARSYEEVRTYQNVLHPTFRDACQARGLIGDDTEWVSLFNEAVTWATPWQLRCLFMTILIYCEVGNVRVLFDAYWKYMADDIAYGLRNMYGGVCSQVPDSVLLDGLMQQLTELFSSNGTSITSFDLPLLASSDQPPNRLIMEEMSYNRNVLQIEAVELQSLLNSEQRAVFDAVLRVVSAGGELTGFVSGHGCTGKTFLWRTITATLRSQGHIVLTVAPSGVAALLLPGGRTAHSRFRIPLDLHEESRCSIARGTNLAALIARASLIIWDEAPMAHRFIFECVDRTLRDVLSVHETSNATKPFGGKPILLGGDFRQILPVLPGGDRNEIIKASLVSSRLWKHFKIMRLTNNMRLSRSSASMEVRSRIASFGY
jgi:hypothetical protein